MNAILTAFRRVCEKQNEDSLTSGNHVTTLNIVR